MMLCERECAAVFCRAFSFVPVSGREYSFQLLILMSCLSSLQNAVIKALASRAFVMSGMLKSIALRRIV